MILNSNKTLPPLKTILVCLGLLVFASGCQKTVTITPDSETQVVVNANFTPGQAWKVNIQQSSGILDNANQIQPITDATAWIYYGTTVVEQLQYNRATQMYINTQDHTPLAGNKYKIAIQIPNQSATVMAEDIIPESSAEIVEFKRVSAGNGFIEFMFDFKDVSSNENFYQISLLEKSYNKISSQGETIRKPLQSKVIPYSIKDFEPIFGLESETTGIKLSSNNGYIFNDDEFNTETKTVLLRISTQDILHMPENNVFSSFEVELRSVSKNYYHYQKSVTEQLLVSQNPLAEPVQIHNNVMNGVGNFSGYSAQNSSNISIE